MNFAVMWRAMGHRGQEAVAQGYLISKYVLRGSRHGQSEYRCSRLDRCVTEREGRCTPVAVRSEPATSVHVPNRVVASSWQISHILNLTLAFIFELPS